MTTFWNWCVRVPAAWLAVAAIGLWYYGAFEADLAFTAASLFGLVAYIAGHLARRAAARARIRAELAAMRPPSLIPRGQAPRDSLDRAA